MTPDALFNVFYQWAVANVNFAGVTVIEEKQNAPRPKRPFVTLNIISQVDQDFSDQLPPDDEGMAEIVNNREISLSIMAYGENANLIIDNLRRSCEKPSVRLEFRRSGVVYIQVLSGFTDETETVSSEYEERANLDLSFRTATIDTDDVGLIEEVEVSGAVNSEIINLTFTIGD